VKPPVEETMTITALKSVLRSAGRGSTLSRRFSLPLLSERLRIKWRVTISTPSLHLQAAELGTDARHFGQRQSKSRESGAAGPRRRRAEPATEPLHYSGVLKPTTGRAARRNCLTQMLHDFEIISPIALTVHDLAMTLSAIKVLLPHNCAFPGF